MGGLLNTAKCIPNFVFKKGSDALINSLFKINVMNFLAVLLRFCHIVHFETAGQGF
jgi:hypothetical protein